MLAEHDRTQSILGEAAQNAQDEIPVICQTIKDVKQVTNRARKAINNFNAYCDDRLVHLHDQNDHLNLKVANNTDSKDDTYLKVTSNRRESFRAAKSVSRAMFRFAKPGFGYNGGISML